MHKLIHHLSTTVTGQIEGLESPGIPLNPKKQDYKHVKYWEQGAWREIRNDPKLKKHFSGNSSIASLFYEDEYGKQVSADVRAAVRQDLLGYWEDMVQDGKMPRPWKSAGFTTQSKFQSAFESKYPWLRLCDGHWKAKQIWIANWKTSRFASPIVVSDSPSPTSRNNLDDTPRQKPIPIIEVSSGNSSSPNVSRKRTNEDDPSPTLPKRQKGKTRAVETPPFHHPPLKPRQVPMKKKIIANVATVRVPIFQSNVT